MTANIILGWKGLPWTNTLAYYKHWYIMDAKSFIRFAPGREAPRGEVLELILPEASARKTCFRRPSPPGCRIAASRRCPSPDWPLRRTWRQGRWRTDADPSPSTETPASSGSTEEECSCWSSPSVGAFSSVPAESGSPSGTNVIKLFLSVFCGLS